MVKMMEESRQMERIVAKECCEEWERGEREEGERGRGKNGKEREATKEILFHPLTRKRERIGGRERGRLPLFF